MLCPIFDFTNIINLQNNQHTQNDILFTRNDTRLI